MKRNCIFGIIFTYILLIGCGLESYTELCYYDLNIYAMDLSQDENGYYWMIFDINSIQIFTQLTAETKSYDIIQKLAWVTNRRYMIGDTSTDLVNSASYTNDDGITYTIFGVWDEFIGDTITVYCGYEDECNNQYLDSLKIILE